MNGISTTSAPSACRPEESALAWARARPTRTRRPERGDFARTGEAFTVAAMRFESLRSPGTLGSANGLAIAPFALLEVSRFEVSRSENEQQFLKRPRSPEDRDGPSSHTLPRESHLRRA